MTTLFDVFVEVLERTSVKEVSARLQVSPSTVSRWLELKNVPKQYEIDIYKMSNKDIDYSKLDYKMKDQFFTPITTAKYVFDVFKEKMNHQNEDIMEYIYIEPSAGNGAFLNVFPKEVNWIALDVEPRHKDIQSQDFLTWAPTQKERKYICFGNPPFGLRGNLALRFINHAAQFCDYVCFILPQLFESDGKGVPRKRVVGLNLIHSEKIDNVFIEPEGNQTKVNVVFQIWSKYKKEYKYEVEKNIPDNVKIYSLSDGGTPSSTRNKHMLKRCDVYLPSTCFGLHNMKCYDTFEDLPGRKGYGIVFTNNKEHYLKLCQKIDWGNTAFLSTNSAYNLRMSSIYAEFL